MNSTTTKRKGRGKSAESLQLIEAAHRILSEIQPASVRAVCYRLFTEKLIPNMSKASTNKVGSQLVYARENAIIPWDWIVDETREAETVASWSNPDSIIRTAVRQYRKDYWEMQPRRVEVWSEKGTVRGTLAPVLKEYGVTFRVMHGYGSATSIHGAAQESVASDKPLTIFYIGDHDPSGLQMSEIDLPERLVRYGGCAEIIRIALDKRDVGADSLLPWFPAQDKASDSRYEWFREHYGSRCWEVDALSPVVLRERVGDAIEQLLDMDAWHHAIGIEAVEKESMRNFFGTWKSISMPANKYSEGGEA